MKTKHVVINTYRVVSPDGDTMTLCINFSTPNPMICTSDKARAISRTFDPTLGIMKKSPIEDNCHNKTKTRDPYVSGGIAFIDVPIDTMKSYVERLVDFLQYAYTSGGATLKLKNEKCFVMKSRNKERSISFTFSEKESGTMNNTVEYVVPVDGKIKLDTYHLRTLMDYLTNHNCYGPF